MRIIKLSAVFIAISLFLTACSSTQPNETTRSTPYPNDEQQTIAESNDENFWAKDNLDLQRVGEVLENSSDAEDFEYRLNRNDGLNNLDLNGDGYADYISVAEYDDRDEGRRGFSLFSRFGADDIQELATIIFDRDRPDRRGARILLNGSEQIYGDNYYYERDRLDKSLDIVDWAFNDRDDYYSSPYYYDYYPDNYETYRVVETPVYRTRIERLYPEPIFIQTTEPKIKNIKIKSPYQGRTLNKIYAKLAKPTKEQKDFIKNNPNPPEFVPVRNGRVEKNVSKSEKAFKDKEKFEKDKRDKPDKIKQKNDKPEKVNRKIKNPGKSFEKDKKPSKNFDGGGKKKGKSKKGGGKKRGKN